MLLSNKFVIYDFFEDIYYLIQKIFGDSNQYLDWYVIFKDEIMKFIPSINDNPPIDSISELFPLYEDQKGGNKNFKLMKKICLSPVYKKSHIYHTLDKEINSCIIAYFVDFFNYFGGYKILFNILCSIYHNKENYKINFIIQDYILNTLKTAKIITGSFSGNEGINKIKKYMDEYSDKFDDDTIRSFFEND